MTMVSHLQENDPESDRSPAGGPDNKHQTK